MCFWLKSPLADTGSVHIWNVIVDSICKQVTVILFYSTTSLHIVGHRKAQGRHQTLCLGSELYLEGSVLKCSCESGIDFFFFLLHSSQFPQRARYSTCLYTHLYMRRHAAQFSYEQWLIWNILHLPILWKNSYFQFLLNKGQMTRNTCKPYISLAH